MEVGEDVGRGVELGFGLPRSDGLQEGFSRSRLRMSPLSNSDGAAKIMVGAARVADDTTLGSCAQRILAVMNSLAQAACMRRRGSSRERQRDKISHQREQQQQSGGQAMHASSRNKNPR